METKIKGTRDYFGKESLRLQRVINILEEVSERYSIEKVVTPTFEKTELFARAVGSEADVVNKEMYTFEDRKGRSISLKPEGTASVVRMVLENKLLDNNNQPNLYYIASMFRYERPQKGRQREFFQYGLERFGKNDIYTDVETVMIAVDILKELNIEKYELQINSIGTSQDRATYNSLLKEFIGSKLEELSDYAKEKYESGNILRVFDSKIQSDLDILEGAPTIFDSINEESKDRFIKTKDLLDKLGVKYVVNNNLVRGLDYYNDLVFEFVSTDVEALGAKSTIIGGGSYNSLVNKFDSSKDVPAIGFAIGLERLMLAATSLDEELDSQVDYFVAVAYQEEDMLDAAIKVANKLRENYKVFTDFTGRKLPKKFELAEKLNSTNVVIIGNEIKEDKVTIKNIKTNEQTETSLKELL